MLVDIPFMELPDAGYISRRVDMRLSPEQALTLRGIFHGIAQELGEDARTADGKLVNSTTDALRVMLDRVRQARLVQTELPVGAE